MGSQHCQKTGSGSVKTQISDKREISGEIETVTTRVKPQETCPDKRELLEASDLTDFSYPITAKGNVISISSNSVGCNFKGVGFLNKNERMVYDPGGKSEYSCLDPLRSMRQPIDPYGQNLDQVGFWF